MIDLATVTLWFLSYQTPFVVVVIVVVLGFGYFLLTSIYFYLGMKRILQHSEHYINFFHSDPRASSVLMTSELKTTEQKIFHSQPPSR